MKKKLFAVAIAAALVFGGAATTKAPGKQVAIDTQPWIVKPVTTVAQATPGTVTTLIDTQPW